MSVIIAILSAAVVLGVVILVHEAGHFFAAKLFGVRVVVFSFGYGPRLFGIKSGPTDYRLSALPLGGYVRLAGDNPAEARTGATDEFLSRPRWQRVLIYLAGPTMNVILAAVLFILIFVIHGVPSPTYLMDPVKIAAVPANSSAATAGIQPGDKVVELAGTPNPTWEKALTFLSKAQAGTQAPIWVERDGQKVPLKLTVNSTDPEQSIGYPDIPPIISTVIMGLPAYHAGIEAGDRVVSVDGKAIPTWPELVDVIHGSNGKALSIVVERKSGDKTEDKTIEVTPVYGQNERGDHVFQIGAGPLQPLTYQRVSFPSAVMQGATLTGSGIAEVLGVLEQLITGKVSVKQLQSVVGIAHESGQAAKRGLIDFVEWTALISINLGILNLLPIPILDGGNIMMLVIEGGLRRDMSLGVKERFVQVGLVFLLVIFAIVMYNDVARTIPHH
jgi:regulator of sigma E protease